MKTKKNLAASACLGKRIFERVREEHVAPRYEGLVSLCKANLSGHLDAKRRGQRNGTRRKRTAVFDTIGE